MTARASSPPPISSCQWSTIHTISAALLQPMPSRTYTRWRQAHHGPGSSRHAGRQDGNGNSARDSEGGAQACAGAGIPVAGGHSIDCPEPVYVSAVTGICRREDIRRNCRCQTGRRIDPYQGAGRRHLFGGFKKEALSSAAYAEMVASMTLLNRIGADWPRIPPSMP